MVKLYIILSISIAFCNAGKGPNRTPDQYGQLAFSQRSIISTYYQLVNIWPNTNINSDDSGLSKKTCEAFFHPNRWIVRGLFPVKRTGHSPTSCIPYVEGFVRVHINDNLKQRLEINWPNILANISAFDHWEHEWHRHGSCIKDIKSMETINGFFEEILALSNKYNIGSMLETYKIFPGESYSVDNIFEILRYEFGTEPRLKCLVVQNSEQEIVQYLIEIVICFNRMFVLESCYQRGTRSCNNNIPVIYPTIQSV